MRVRILLNNSIYQIGIEWDKTLDIWTGTGKIREVLLKQPIIKQKLPYWCRWEWQLKGFDSYGETTTNVLENYPSPPKSERGIVC